MIIVCRNSCKYYRTFLEPVKLLQRLESNEILGASVV